MAQTKTPVETGATARAGAQPPGPRGRAATTPTTATPTTVAHATTSTRAPGG